MRPLPKEKKGERKGENKPRHEGPRGHSKLRTLYLHTVKSICFLENRVGKGGTELDIFRP